MCERDSPGAQAGASAAADAPNQRDMKPRFCGADAPGAVEDWRCSGDWADGFVSTVGEAATLTVAMGGGGEEMDTDGDCGSTWEGTGGWGVLGLELPVDAPLGGTMGDWEPEDGLWPLAGPGEP